MTWRALGALFVACSSAAFAQEPLPPNLRGAEKLAALIQRVSQIQASAKTLTANFEQVRTTRLLAEPSRSRGRFYFRAPDAVRWEYEAPRPMTVLLEGGVALTYIPAEKRAERIEVGRAQRRVFRFLSAAEPLEQLKAYFRFTFRDPGAAGNYTLLLEPTAHTIKKRVHSLTIEIDRNRLLPIAVSYTEADGDTTSYVFTDIILNQPQPEGMYSVDLPADVKIVSLRIGGGE
jgi:outer membrane lipoprotein carrier protein